MPKSECVLLLLVSLYFILNISLKSTYCTFQSPTLCSSSLSGWQLLQSRPNFFLNVKVLRCFRVVVEVNMHSPAKVESFDKK